MSKRADPIQAVIIGNSRAGTATVFSILDVLASVGRDWEILHGAPPAAATFAASLRTVDGAPYWDINGRRITPDTALDDGPAPRLVVVPEMHLDPSGPLPDDLSSIACWTAGAYENGATVASVCSGALVLAEAGLLDGNEATTHWAFADMLARSYPRVKVRRERILVPTGEGHRVITAGGASAWEDLLLYLVGRFAGADTARRIAKLHLIEPHGDGQLTYASLAAGRQHEDRLVADAQVWAADNYIRSAPVAGMATRSGLSERGFHRRFRRATGQAPADYIQSLRVEEAKQILETTDMPIDDIAGEVGYSEPSSFRAAFRKRVGISPSVYRRKWRAVSAVGGV
jgi:transcriptional regulator GlxA family with amidase domain